MFFFFRLLQASKKHLLIANGRKKKQTKFSIKYPDILLVMFKDSQLQLTICTVSFFKNAI